jgi:hypothetical protein
VLLIKNTTVVIIELGDSFNPSWGLSYHSAFLQDRQDILEAMFGSISRDIGHELTEGDSGEGVFDPIVYQSDLDSKGKVTSVITSHATLLTPQ